MSVEQNDESHVSLESSSSPLPNQKDDDDDDFDVDAEPRLYRESRELFVDLRRNPSMALPMTCGSTNPRLSHRKRLFDFGFSLAFSSLSLKRSSTSFENDTVTLAVLRSDFFRAIGWCRFSNQPDNAAALLSACVDVPATICLALCKIDTSKLFDRFDRDIPAGSGVSKFDDVDGFDLAGDVSPHLLISVADDANDVIMDIRSVLVTTIPVRLKKLLDAAFFELPAAEVVGVVAFIITFSDARRVDAAGIGASVEPTKSE